MNIGYGWSTQPYKTVMRLDNSKLQNVTNDLHGKGFYTIATDVPFSQEDTDDIYDSLPSRTQNGLRNRSLELIPRAKTVFGNGRDTITGLDFDIREGIRRQRDPLFKVLEVVPNTASLLLREILNDTASVDAITNGLSGVFSAKFKASVIDIARLTGEDPNVVYNRCINKMISGSVYAMRGGQVRRYRPIKSEQQRVLHRREAYSVE